MEAKTNKYIYPFKIEFDKVPTWSLIKKNYTTNNRFKNKVKLENHEASLIFLKEDSGFLFFKLVKYNGKNIAIADYGKKIDFFAFLKPKQHIINHSLFAIKKDSNILFVLYNHEAFGRLTSALTNYFDEIMDFKINKCEPLSRDFTKKDEAILKDIINITVKKAVPNYIKYEAYVKGNSSSKIKRYTELHESTVKLQKISKVPKNILAKRIREFKKEDYEHIYITSKNIDKYDLMDKLIPKQKCDVNVNSSNLSKENDFIKEVNRVYNENKKFIDLF